MSGCRFGGAVLSCVGDGASERACRMGLMTGLCEMVGAAAGAGAMEAGAVVGGGGRGGVGVDASMRITGGAGACR